jgi:stress response protein YsnF
LSRAFEPSACASSRRWRQAGPDAFWNGSSLSWFDTSLNTENRGAPHGRRQAFGQHSEEPTPGGLADEIGGAFSITEHDERAISLLEEQLHVAKVAAVTDQVRVRTVVEERPEHIEAMLERGILDVERLPAFREVNETPPPRQDGDTVIISIVEERLVKRRFVVEEVFIRTKSITERAEFEANVRIMRAEIERSAPDHQEGRDSDG